MAIRRPPTTFSDTISTADIADDAITSAKLDTNLSVAGTLGVTGALTASGGIANSGTIAAGTVGSSVVFPTGHIIQINQSFSQASVSRTGVKNSWASTHYKCTLPNNLKSGSKLYCTFSGIYGEQEGGHWSSATSFTFYQNSQNIIGNQLTFTDYVDSNAEAGGGSAQDADRALASSNLFTNSQYQRSQIYMTALFTPTGTDAAKREVEVYWRSASSGSYTSYIGRGAHNTGGDWQRYGCQVVTIMEIAG